MLQEMLAIMPKHKGTEKLQAELRTKISKLRKEEQRKRAQRRKVHGYHVEREGAAQVVLVGPPNSGKSQLVATLTNATPEIAAYPFTTRKPSVGMMDFEDIKIQLVDTPPLTEDSPEWWMVEIMRNADLLLGVFDLGEETLAAHAKTIMDRLEQSKITVSDAPKEEGYVEKKLLILANKSDVEGAEVRFDRLKGNYQNRFQIVKTTLKDLSQAAGLKRLIFDALCIVRVYTKAPGKPADMKDPLILRRGDTVLDAGRSIHKDFGRELKYARVWGGDHLQGQRVEKTYALQDKDIVEFHI